MKRRLRIFLPPFVLFAAALVLCISGLLDREYVFANFDTDKMVFPSGKEAEIARGDSYGVLASSGPHFNLDPGEYRLQWSDYADGENAFLLSFGNGAQIEPSELIMREGEEDGEFFFRVLEPGTDLKVETDFRSGTHLALLFLRLYTPPVKDPALTVLVLTALAAILWALQRVGWLTRSRAASLIALCGVLIVAIAPALRISSGIWETKNALRQLARIDAVANAIKNGRFPDWFSFWYDCPGGACVSVFRPDAFVLPFAALRLSGASAAYALNTWMIAVSILGAAAVYTAARGIGADRDGALLATMLYLLMPGRLDALYRRAAFDELTALSFLCFLPRCLKDGSKSKLAFCGVAVFLACPPIGIALWAAAAVTAVVCCLCGKRAHLTECAAILVSMPLTAFQWMPMLTLWKKISLLSGMADWHAAALAAFQLLLAIAMIMPLQKMPKARQNGIGLLLLLAVLALSAEGLDGMIARDGLPKGYGSDPAVFWTQYALAELPGGIPNMTGTIVSVAMLAVFAVAALCGHGQKSGGA